MRVGTVAILAFACAAIAAPSHQYDSDVVPVAWDNVEAGAHAAAGAGYSKQWANEGSLEARDPAKSGAESGRRKSSLWGRDAGDDTEEVANVDKREPQFNYEAEANTYALTDAVADTAADADVNAQVAGTTNINTQATSDFQCVSPSSNCVGDVTHWDGGLGACGWDVDSNSQLQVALPVGIMGGLSNSNPYCGKSLTIQSPSGATVQAIVGDKCMGCVGASIDLTNALFNQIAPGVDGRGYGYKWWLN